MIPSWYFADAVSLEPEHDDALSANSTEYCARPSVWYATATGGALLPDNESPMLEARRLPVGQAVGSRDSSKSRVVFSLVKGM